MIPLTIVTSCTPNYAAYLEEWAASIVAQTVQPEACAILLNGDGGEHHARAAETILLAAGIPVRVLPIDATDYGTARNAAVALASSEWVMHLDADDTLMPHCLADVAALMPDADVVALGYERSGDLAAGPKNLRRTYSNTQGAETLRASAPASGVSPFRRSFWERSPYRTDMIGGWDTALWLGFAHMDARFRATTRPVFWYRQHADSVFNTRRLDERTTALVGAKLQALRDGRAGVSVLIPWRDDNGPRRLALQWVRAWYAEHFPDWQVVIGASPPGPWNKGAAVADALTRATGLTLLIADADCVTEPATLRAAVDMVARGRAPWGVPHTLVHRLDEASTGAVLEAGPRDAVFEGHVIRHPYRGFAGGGFVVVDRSAYETVGGIPQAFAGWGAEDEALALVLDAIVGPHVRLDADLWHLWHEPGKRMRDPDYASNRQLLRRYQAAAGNPDAMWALIRNGARQRNRPLERARLRAARAARDAEVKAAREKHAGLLRRTG